MAIKKENQPSPNVLMNSLRSIGYSFQSAIADIIDNSISAKAKNIWITAPIDNDIFVSILDDGEGMNDEMLFNAMKYGSEKIYESDHLGRFGVGLKSASLSQCRVLTVCSKKDGVISAYQWNLNSVDEDKKWNCLKLEYNEIEEVPNIDGLKSLREGTLVVWQDFDVLFKKSGGKLLEAIDEETSEAEHHICLVFHRFLNRPFNPLNIYLNERKLIGLDPFLENNPRTDTQEVDKIEFEESIVTIQPYILPHTNYLEKEDIEKLGGPQSLRNEQGFYI